MERARRPRWRLEPVAAIVSLLLASLWAAWRHPPWRPVLANGLLPGLLLWLGGTAVLDRLPQAAAHTLPEWQLPTIDGGLLPLTETQGRPVVLNLWATWCPPCRREMPALQQARQDHPGVRVVLLNQGESGSIVARYLAEAGLSADDVALDPASQAGRHFSLPVLPSTLFFDAEGNLVDVRLGELSRATLADRLRRLAPPRSPYAETATQEAP
ncbi:MAG: TlpA family protein disulfide reductase [Pigmentiphaga sp.]